MINRIRQWVRILLCMILLVPVSACSSSSDALQGNWVLESSADSVMSFNKNGSVDNILYTSPENGAVTKYSLKDGNLVLTFENGATETIDQTDSEENALSNFDEYYLDGDTLVFRRRVYYREGSDVLDTTETENSQETADATDTAEPEVTGGSVENGQQYQATISVEGMGDIVLTLDEGIAPKTVENFIKLANSGFYDGTTFHRIIEGFMIQGGDPLGNGTGGSDENVVGEFLANGFDNTLSHKRGVISMARSSDYNSGSSQFFIVQEDSLFLDGQYAAFGWVTEGMDIVDKIAGDANPTDDNGTIPADEQPVISSIRVVPLES